MLMKYLKYTFLFLLLMPIVSYAITVPWNKTVTGKIYPPLVSDFVGIGTTTPYAPLSVVGQAVAQYFTGTSTTAVNSFPQYNSTNGTTTNATSTNLNLSSLTASRPVFSDATKNLVSKLIDLASTGDISGILAIANGGTNASSQTTDGVNFFNGTSITSGTGLTFDGLDFGIASTSPYAKLSVTNTGAGPSFIVEDSTSPDQSPAIFVAADGRVGIATSTLTTGQELTIGGSVNILEDVTGEGYTMRGVSTLGLLTDLTVSSDISLVNTNNVHVLIDSNNNDTARFFSVRANAGTGGSALELVKFTELGANGFGTSTPMAKLSASSTDMVTAVFDQRGTPDILQVRDAGVNVLVVEDGGQTLHSVGSESVPGISFIGDDDTGIYQSSGSVNITADGTKILEVSNSFLDSVTVTGNLIATGAGHVLTGINQFVGTLAVVVMTISSPATNDDPTENTMQYRLATTDATVTTIGTIAIPSSTTVGIQSTCVARRTGGVAGTAEDGALYVRYSTLKNVAGTATEIADAAAITQESQAGWNYDLNPSGSDVLLRVTGATDNNITWHCTVRTYPVSS